MQDARAALGSQNSTPLAPAPDARELELAPSPLDDPALVRAAQEIEDGMLYNDALDGDAMSSAMAPDAFNATIDAFALQGLHNPDARRMTDLLRGTIAVQLGEAGGRLDRIECGRLLCAAQYTVRGPVPSALREMGSGISRTDPGPGGFIFRTIFSTDPRFDGVRVRRRDG